MIKLNNKNITYVALADSSNSLKAPKEIWYADSNNSVKLVYRRKDALIEGEDYEKYHWLVGDADAYINTLKYYRPYDDSVQMTLRDNLYPNRKSKYNKYNVEEQIWGACETNNLSVLIRSYVSGNAPNSFCNNIIDGSTADSAVSWGTYATQNYINESPEHSLYISSVDANTDKYYFIYNGNTKSNLPTRYTLPELVQQDVRIFYSGLLTNGYFNGSFSNFIHYRNNVEITHLIPCKLLKPVPKWLDANGIRRQVGECGMIDLVSGKFYGNVNSTGTFTVENYYERKEWLVGDGSAYISGITYNLWDNHLVSQVYNINKKYAQFVQSGINNSDKNISMTRNSIYLQIIFRELSQTNTTHIADLNPNDFSGAIDLDYYISDSNFNVKVNGVTYTNASGVYATKSKWKSFNGLSIYSEMMSYISEITPSGIYVSNLIPCTLTMDLPASMDANNIARTKGTSGMWDLVSDRFYGNVASSGTFKAVNLAEGVDYEVHQWLTSNTGIPMLSTSINLYKDTLEVKFIPTSEVGTKFIWSSMAELDTQSGDTIECRCIIGTQNELSIRHGIRDSNPHSIFDIASRYKNNEYNVLLYPENNYIKGNVNGTAVTEHSIDNRTNIDAIMYIYTYSAKIGLFSVGNVHLIPVKLLKSIPAKYDANGKARNAGECGMYDTVNDKFYGNVASSGTFSVYDDWGGVIYQEHKWLVGSVNEGATLPANGADIELDTPIFLTDKVMTITMGSVCRDIVMYGSSVNGAKYIIPMYSYASGETHIQERYGNDNTIHSIVDNLSGTKTITIDFKNKVATVGSNSFNIDGVGYRFQRFGNLYWSATKTIGNITIDNELNLVPCQLLKSIPASMDGNNTARSAGECGMWDKVANKFYGNVSGYGTFSVSD